MKIAQEGRADAALPIHAPTPRRPAARDDELGEHPGLDFPEMIHE